MRNSFGRCCARTLLAALIVVPPTMFSSASAGDERYLMHPTALIAVRNAPVAVTGCRFNNHPYYAFLGDVEVANRSDRFLRSFTVRWTLFDRAGAPMGRRDHVYALSNGLAPGESAMLVEGFDVRRTEPAAAITHVTCRLEAVKLEGNQIWTYGHPWGRAARAAKVPISARTSPDDPADAARNGSAGAPAVSQ